MKRAKFLRYLTDHGCALHREGGNHSMWKNLQTGRKQAVPRHTEIDPRVIKSICNGLSIETPREK